MNNSSTGGYLQATSPAPMDDQALFRFIQQWFVGILSEAVISGANFFPRWQIEPPNYPGPSVDWAAFGIETTAAQLYPYIVHVAASGSNPAYDQEEMHEWIDILISLYGPNCNRNARALRDGMYIDQNREILGQNDMALIETGEIRTAPSLVKERWQYRVDFRAKLRRRIVRQYAIASIEGIGVTVNNESYVTPVRVIRPAGDMSVGEAPDFVTGIATVH